MLKIRGGELAPQKVDTNLSPESFTARVCRSRFQLKFDFFGHHKRHPIRVSSQSLFLKEILEVRVESANTCEKFILSAPTNFYGERLLRLLLQSNSPGWGSFEFRSQLTDEME